MEDDVEIRRLVHAILSDAGYRVATASDAGQALKSVRPETRPALLLTDIGLPGCMGGIELAVKLVQQLPSIKVLFMSGHVKIYADKIENLDPGIRIIRKPCRKSDLLENVQNVLERRECRAPV